MDLFTKTILDDVTKGIVWMEDYYAPSMMAIALHSNIHTIYDFLSHCPEIKILQALTPYINQSELSFWIEEIHNIGLENSKEGYENIVADAMCFVAVYLATYPDKVIALDYLNRLASMKDYYHIASKLAELSIKKIAGI